MLSLVLSLLMVVTMLPTFVFSSSTTAEAKDAPKAAADDYWQILASTDFTGTTWTKSSDYVWTTSSSPRTSKGGYSMGWNTQTNDNESSANTVDSAGIHFNNSDYRGLLALSSFKIGDTQYNNGNYRSLFKDVNSFKIDLTFSYTGNSYGQGGTLDSRQNGSPLLKLSKDTSGKLKFNDRECWNEMYFTQEAYGRRHIDGTKDIGEGSTEGGVYSISTYNSTGLISANNELHYIVYVADGWLGCYLTDANYNTIINYEPLDFSSYSLTPEDITSIYLGGSRFSWTNHSDLSNVAYKSIEIYKGAETVTTDTSKSKYLYTYFTGNSTNGESLHYAVSDDGINFKPVNDGLPVWDSTASWSIPQYPTGSTSGVATSKHVRDPYILNKRNTSTGEVSTGYYILATDLNTQNGTNWGNNSKLLVYDVNNLANIDSTTPWVIDTTDMCASLTGGTVSRAWAPQAIWDNAKGKYMLYWSVGYVGGLTKLYYIYTSDFKTFEGTPQQLIYPTFCNSFIDADITYHNGVYYMYFKDEDAKKVYRAIAPRPNGPYQGFTKFSDTGMEGPQVYELVDGSYALMTDVYGEGNYYIYQANNPKGFDASSASTTNINYLSPRHGSVIRITPAEYNAIVSHFGTLTPNTVEYYWANDANFGNADKGFTMKDTAGHDYEVAWYRSGGSTGGNKLTLNAGGVHSADSQMCEIVTGYEYTVDFTFKGTAAGEQDDNHTVFSISKAGNGDENKVNYVRISASGKFFVNATEVSCTSALATAVTDTSDAHNYKVTFNGYATCLLVDGTYVGGVVNTTAMPSDLWMTFGWGRSTTFEDYRMSGEWGIVTISPTATNIGETAEEALLDTVSPDRDELTSAPSFDGKVYHVDSECTGGYSNVIWCPKNMSWSGKDSAGGDSDSNIQWTNSKIAQQRQAVLAYDGAHQVYMPVVYETYCQASHSNKTDYVSSNGSVMKLTQNWTGYQDGNYTQWPGSSSGTSIGYDDSHKSEYSFNNTKTHRFFWNKLYYTGTGDTTNYYETQGNLTFWSHNYKDYWGSGWDSVAMYSANTYYVINYQPIYDIVTSNDIVNTPRGNMTASALYDYLMGTSYSGEALWMYTTASRIEALVALKEVADCNPNNYNFSANTESTVQTCAADIKKAYQGWQNINLIKKDFSITYRMYNGTTHSAVVQAGNNINNKTSGDAIPDNSDPIHIAGTNTHRLNSWTSSTGVWDGTIAPSGTHVPHSNETYVETTTENTAHCAYSDEVDYNDGWTHHDGATTDDNGYSTSYCMECNGSEKVWDAQNWTAYDALIEEIEDKKTNSFEDNKYTTSSISNYNDYYDENIASLVIDRNDESKSDTYITNAKNSINTKKLIADTYLNPLAEYEKLLTKQTTREINNYVENVQQYTYDTWMSFATKYDDGKTYYDATPDKSNVGMYEVLSSGVVDKTNTTIQQETIVSKSDLTNAAYEGLLSVDSDANYEPFGYANTVAENVDTDKYINSAVSAFNTAKQTAYNAAYHKLTAEDYAAYNASTNSSFAVGTPIKNSNNVSVQTNDMLTAITNLNQDANIKRLWVTLTVQNEDAEDPLGTETIYSGIKYGESAEISLDKITNSDLKNAIAKKSVDRWSITNYSFTDNHEGEDAISSSKLSGANSSFTKTVTNNLAVLALVSDSESETASDMKVVINDIYNQIKAVYYVPSGTTLPSGDALNAATITIGTYQVTADKVPFYGFDNWTMSESGGAYIFRPHYTVVDRYDFSAIGGTVSQTEADYDTRINLTYNASIEDAVETKNSLSDVSFVAWAVKTAEGKYQIASYNQDYFFYACADENYVPIMDVDSSSANTYKAVLDNNGTLSDELTAAMIDASIPGYADINSDAVLKNKLDNQLPFVAVQRAEMANREDVAGTPKYTKVRVFVRVTNGAKNLGGYGVIIKSNCAEGFEKTFTAENATMKRTVTNILPTGQFTYTLSNAKGFNNAVGFRGFVNYDITYKTTTVNAIEYSNGARATV